MTENRDAILRSQDRRFFINLQKEAKLREHRPFIGRDGLPIRTPTSNKPIRGGGER